MNSNVYTPTFSIITPMWKGAELISQTITSVLNQTYTDWEMIIVDDCSPDNGEGASIVKKYSDKDNRINLIVLDKNVGSSGARNVAIKQARSRYLAFLDSDDIWHSEYLYTMKQRIDDSNDNNIAVYYSGYRRMDSTCSQELLKPFSDPGIKTYRKLLLHCPIFPSAAIVDYEKLGIKVLFREELKNLRDDYVFWLDILKQGFVAEGYEDVLVDYRMRDDSLTSKKYQMVKPQWNVYRNILKLGLTKSVLYLFSWAINGLQKYR